MIQVKRIIPFALSLTLTLTLHSWGFQAHREINHIAIYGLPVEMFGFYKANVSYLTEHAVSADMRRYIDTLEGYNHYLDSDHYDAEFPLDSIYRNYDTMCNKYGAEEVLKHGILPWNLLRVFYGLRAGFNSGNREMILKYSADLGHYVGDLHVPLHTTANYNGQLSDQHGIHALWESRLVKLNMDDYDLWVDTAEYIADVSDFIWVRYEESARLVDSVLLLERRATEQVGEEFKFAFEETNGMVKKEYSRRFCNVYSGLLNNMVQRRMRKSIHALRCLWMTAWVEAGQPDLNSLDQSPDKLPFWRRDSTFQMIRMIGRGEGE